MLFCLGCGGPELAARMCGAAVAAPGVFGARMQVEIVNDGPMTIVLDV